MTELQWLESDNLWTMLSFAGEKLGARKLRLFGCACCRQVWDMLTAPEQREAVEVAERYADGLASREELLEANRPLLTDEDCETPPSCVSDADAGIAAEAGLRVGSFVEASLSARDDGRQQSARLIRERLMPVRLLRDQVGPMLFRPVALDPRWRTATVLDLTAGVYDRRSFDLMPILADALMDAGCDDEDVLYHCRREAPHARGCWVVDLLLGKA